MTKRIAILAVLVALAVALAGCGVKPPIKWDETEERARVLEAMNGWVDGVEKYDVDAMAGNGIMASSFKLNIYEGARLTVSGKELGDLREDLNGDATVQADYRENKGYLLRLDIDDAAGVEGRDDVNAWTIVSIDRLNAKVAGKFEVYETADDLEGFTGGRIVDGWWNSDEGAIDVTLIRTPNAWKMTDMTITFDAGIGPASVRLPSLPGFAFGNPKAILGW